MEINGFGSYVVIREREKLIYGSYELKLNGEGEFWAKFKLHF